MARLGPCCGFAARYRSVGRAHRRAERCSRAPQSGVGYSLHLSVLPATDPPLLFDEKVESEIRRVAHVGKIPADIAKLELWNPDKRGGIEILAVVLDLQPVSADSNVWAVDARASHLTS